tara:strand:- start:19 stop:357 length:339 start_codon:yes stop_codon:yes gene_type:complete
LCSCSILNNERIYEGTYQNDNVTLIFENSRKGKLIVNGTDSIPFQYKIESTRTNPKAERKNNEKVKLYVYRFTVSAEYELSFPLGFIEIGQKKGDVLQGNNGMTLVRKRNQY